jgi:hypothetical protein
MQVDEVSFWRGKKPAAAFWFHKQGFRLGTKWPPSKMDFLSSDRISQFVFVKKNEEWFVDLTMKDEWAKKLEGVGLVRAFRKLSQQISIHEFCLRNKVLHARVENPELIPAFINELKTFGFTAEISGVSGVRQ